MKTKELHLSDVKWKPFLIAGKKGIFNIKATKSGIDKNKLNIEEGSTPYITRTEINNGINLFVTEKQNNKYIMDTSNSITIGLDTQSVFYQEYDFFTGQNIQILKCDRLNKKIALFIIPLLKIQMEKFNWGGNGATLGRLNRTQIMLPVDKKGNPNWQFMEDYITQEQKKTSDKVLAYYENKLNSINVKFKTLSNISDIVSWKEFFLEKVFDIKSGVRLTKADQEEGNRPFIGASDSNNGITEFVLNSNKSLDQNVLGVNYNGSVGEVFYHPYECIFSDDVKRLQLKSKIAKEDNKNENVYLFLKQSILQQKEKFGYGYKFNATRMKRQIIMLPVRDKNIPDFDCMEYQALKEQKRQIDMIIKYLKEKY